MTLADRWLRALRTTDRFAIGRECDYARAEGDADLFDPIGLLAIAADDVGAGHLSTETGWRYYPGAGGAYYARQWAARWAADVGLTEGDLHTLCLMTDDGLTGWAAANWAERQMEVRRGA